MKKQAYLTFRKSFFIQVAHLLLHIKCCSGANNRLRHVYAVFLSQQTRWCCIRWNRKLPAHTKALTCAKRLDKASLSIYNVHDNSKDRWGRALLR